MDVLSTLDGQRFAWDASKAKTNLAVHDVTFEQAREVFLDAFALYEEASADDELRWSCLGRTFSLDLLFVVHVERDGDVLRIISARRAEPNERTRYENA